MSDWFTQAEMALLGWHLAQLLVMILALFLLDTLFKQKGWHVLVWMRVKSILCWLILIKAMLPLLTIRIPEGVSQYLPGYAAESAAMTHVKVTEAGFGIEPGLFMILVSCVSLIAIAVFAWMNFALWRFRRRLTLHTRVLELDDRLEQLVRELTSAYQKAPVIRVSKAHYAPFVMGLIRPLIVLPASAFDGADSVRDERLEMMLRHELTHIRRGDLIKQRMILMINCLYWFFPPLWWVARQLRQCHEVFCDRQACQMLKNPGRYQRALIEIALSLPDTANKAPSTTTMALMKSADIVTRLHILGGTESTKTRTRKSLEQMVCGLILVFSVTLLPTAYVSQQQIQTQQYKRVAINSLQNQPGHGSMHAAYAIRYLSQNKSVNQEGESNNDQ